MAAEKNRPVRTGDDEQTMLDGPDRAAPPGADATLVSDARDESATTEPDETIHDAHRPAHRSDDDATRIEAAAERGEATFSDADVPDDAEATMNEATAGDSAGADATVVLPSDPAGGRGDATVIEPDNSAAGDRSPGELGAGPPSEAGTVAHTTGTGGPEPEAQPVVLPRR